MTVKQFAEKNGCYIKEKTASSKHISKRNGRQCFHCNDKIENGTECITDTYSLKNRYEKLQLSYHVNCYFE